MDPLTLLCTFSVLAGGLYWFVYVFGSPDQRGKHAVDLSSGSIEREKVHETYNQYWSFFHRPKQIETEEKVPAFVDTFYDLVTDIYEWGWGQSFYFTPAFPGKSNIEATRIHEQSVVDLICDKPGQKILDVGCGVGGPMRTIAAHSGCNVVGITINEYQVSRAKAHNEKAGLVSLCDVVCGNFLDMPFEDESFDGAYSIEATCHAPKLEDVYREIFRVLKPGSMYCTHEWVTTELYRDDDPDHVEIIHEIERGNALPGLRRKLDVADVAKKVGFEVVKEEDLGKVHPWWLRLKSGRIAYWRNHVLVTVLEAFGVAPKGTAVVHDMLVKTADYLTRGGEAGIFTPMHMILCKKPEKPKES